MHSQEDARSGLTVQPPRLLGSQQDIARPDKRRAYRRAADRRIAILAAITAWLANKQAQPFFIIDDRKTLILANDAGKRLLKDRAIAAIEVRGKLEFLDPLHRSKIDQVIGNSVHSVSWVVTSPGKRTAIRVNRVNECSQLGLLIVCASSEPFSGLCHELLRRSFALTRAESEIALDIMKGSSLVTIAAARGVSINTVKTQVRHVFHKCGVRSKVHLARRIGDLVALRDAS